MGSKPPYETGNRKTGRPFDRTGKFTIHKEERAMNGFFGAVKDNAGFVGVCLVAVVVMVAIAYGFEKAAKKASGNTDRVLATRKVVMIGMFAAISGILYCFDFALPIAPSFYKLDFSELPALIAGFAFGPVAGVLVEFIKEIVKLLLKSSSTAFVGDLANFLIGCMLVLPASVIYQFHKSKRSALISCAVGTLVMTVFGTWFNAVYLLPTFAKLYGMPLDAILGMGAAINAGVKDITSFVILMVAPINIIKGVGISAITMLVYKKLSPIIKYGNTPQESVKAAD
jgi:riboflavin transporter FmnP